MTSTLFLSCERGCSSSVARELELKKFTGTVTEYDTYVLVEGLNKEELVRAAYVLQTPLFIGMKLASTQVSLGLEESLLQLNILLGNLDFAELFVKDKSFSVSCSRQGAHEYNSVDISQEAGRVLKRLVAESVAWTPQVDIKKPDIPFHIHIDDKDAVMSLDLTGRDLSKRAYKVFNNPHSIKGPVAVCLLMESGWKPGEILVDPFTSGGVLPIETALFSTGTSQHFYDKQLICFKHPLFSGLMSVLEEVDAQRKDTDAGHIFTFDAKLPNVTAAKKNAKIAGVEKSITFSKMEVEWLDIKLASKSVNRMVAHPLETSKHIAENKAKKVHKDLFYQADYVLKKGGTVSFICHRPEDLLLAGEEYGFKAQKQKLVHTGKLPMWILVMGK